MPKRKKTPDYCAEEHARLLAERIRMYWAERGYFVRVELVRSKPRRSGKPLYSVRSDMVRGLPRAYGLFNPDQA